MEKESKKVVLRRAIHTYNEACFFGGVVLLY